MNETLVPLDLSDAIAMIERQGEQIAALETDLRAAYDKVSELLGDRTVLTAENKQLQEAVNLLINFVPNGWEMPLGYTQVVAQAQESLGQDFQKVLDEHRYELYVDEGPDMNEEGDK